MTPFKKSPRCPINNKRSYTDEISAKLALGRISERFMREQKETRAYQCKCGSWHLTSRPEGVN